jgi:hypothetical protein
VPGGPYNNTPFCGPRSFPCEKSSGFCKEESPVHTKLAC